MTNQPTEIAIVGGGMVGGALALGLAQHGFAVTVIEHAEPAPFVADSQPDVRISAISAASVSLLKGLGVWDAVHHVAGIVLCPVNSTSEADLQRYANSSTPLLITMRPLDWQQLPVDYVGVDSHAGVREATEYLIQQGHRDIVFIGGLTHHMRYQGYLEAMNHHGLQPWSTDAFSLRAEPTQANGYQLMQQLLDMPSPPTAVICYNDLMAFGAESALGERGLFAGEDISLIGNDGVAACAYSNPPLTTIAVEPLALGKQAAQQILRRIAQPDAPLSHYIYRPTLQIRASTGKRGR